MFFRQLLCKVFNFGFFFCNHTNLQNENGTPYKITVKSNIVKNVFLHLMPHIHFLHIDGTNLTTPIN